MSKRKYYNNKMEDITDEIVAKTESTNEESVEVSDEELSEEPVDESALLIGVVTGCTRLNVRAEASFTSEVLTIVDAGVELQIHGVGTTDEFFKVTTEFGIDGYAMRQFVSIN